MGLLDSVSAWFKKPKADKLYFTIGPVRIIAPRRRGLMAFILLDNQEVDVVVSAQSAALNPAPLDGAPQFSVTDPEILALTVDGNKATITATGKLGVAQLHVTADADLGEGVKTLEGVLDFEVKAGEAVSLSISPGAPRPKP